MRLGVARYHDIAEALRGAITRGFYERGSQLPSERELSEEFDVAPGTIRQALGELETEGVLASRRGSRRTVVGEPRAAATFEEFRSFAQWASSRGRVPAGHVISAVWQDASPLDLEELRLPTAARVFCVVRVRLLDGSAIMVERTRYRDSVGTEVERIPSDCPSVTAWLAATANITFSRAEHQFSACPARAEDARLLEVRRGSPLLMHKRVSFSRDGLPLEWSVDRYVAGTIRLVVDNSLTANALRWE
ncbi:GntR family transcriptional regulator [Cryobacterium suzukii]|uniref:GntR family transcriptional regulator n=1 Tax=Cryobacterium suzukii TaxID=1259198 RepID=A0A4R9AHE8_9MICO|nr:GntR family transcriptional regulator [Cryobacterium suzukii]